MKIAILDMYNNVPNEGMRCLKTIVGRFLAQKDVVGNYDIFNVRAENKLPDLSYDIFISSGGPGNPLESGEDWEANYLKLIDTIFEHNQTNENKKYLFLICHSFQIVSRHLNVGTVCKRKSTAFGIMPIHQIDEVQDVFFKGLPKPFYVVDSRDYQLINSNQNIINELGIKILCLEKIRPHVPLERAVMAIRFSKEIFGTQFHPEADAEGMLRYFKQEDKKHFVIAEHGEEKYHEMIDRLDDPDKIILTEATILPNFLRSCSNK